MFYHSEPFKQFILKNKQTKHIKNPTQTPKNKLQQKIDKKKEIEKKYET